MDCNRLVNESAADCSLEREERITRGNGALTMEEIQAYISRPNK